MCRILTRFNGSESLQGEKKKHLAALNGHTCVLQVVTKTVAQCVEFYYTYKKHVKIGRNGTLLYGEAEPAESGTGEEETGHKVGTFYGMLWGTVTQIVSF